MLRFAPASLLLLAVLAGCVDTDVGDEADGGEPPLRFLVIGDQGTGGDAQYQVAAAMQQVCQARGCDMVLAMGDNIYEAGAADAYDEQFETKFERPYANLSMPFWMTLGNHDNSYDPTTALLGVGGGLGHWYAAGDAEVAYHYRSDRSSEKWHMPARYYAFEEGPATFVAIDTNTLMFFGQAFPPSTITYQQQEAFVEATLREADTPWRIVFGHHPYISNGAHGDAGAYDGGAPLLAGPYVQQFYEEHVCSKVDIILAGHDHDLQWLEPVPSCGKTVFLVSGAAGKTRSIADPDRNAARFQLGDTHGFVWAEIDGDQFTGAFYDADAQLLYEDGFQRVA